MKAPVQPLTPTAASLFTALAPEQQCVIVLSMQAFWEARHPRSRRFRESDLLATPKQRKAYAAWSIKCKRDNARAMKGRSS